MSSKAFLIWSSNARAVNVPVRLVETLEIHKLEHDVETLLVHLSTDNVYKGSQSFYREESPCQPVNCYGVTKRDAEILIEVRLSNCTFIGFQKHP